MLTILAWLVFVPAVLWNVIFFVIAFGDIFSKQKVDWNSRRNLRDTILTLTVLFVPGVYLFGLF